MAYTFDISDNRRIVEALKTGDEETFKEVYTAFCAPLRHYATTILQNEQAAYEVVQDVFTAVWLNRKRLDAAKPLRNYLLRAVHNNSLRLLKYDEVRRRWMSRATLAGSAAAIVAAVVLVVRQPGVLPEPDAFAQLQQMGVTVERPQVVMTADDGMRLVLENAARLERRSEGEVALRTETGEQRPLATERKLKVEVPNGRQFRLVLDDGSEVWLNAGSKLEYPATFENASERCVRIEGEAFFEIKRDTCRPFCVELGDGECIRVLGTSFNVNAYAGNGRHVTTLVTGRIGYAASAGAEEVVLEPNQQVSRDLAAGTVAVSAVDASVYGAWKEGWLWFENESLPALAERLGRIYGIRVEVAARLGEYTFSGKIRQDRGVEYILNLLSETSDVICKVENGVMRLS